MQLARATWPRSPPGDPGSALTTASHSAPLAQALGPRGRVPRLGCRPSPPRLGRSRQPLAPRVAEEPGESGGSPGNSKGREGGGGKPGSSSAARPPQQTRRPLSPAARHSAAPSRPGPEPQRRARRKSRPRTSSTPRAAPAGLEPLVGDAGDRCAGSGCCGGHSGNTPLCDVPCGPRRKPASPGKGRSRPGHSCRGAGVTSKPGGLRDSLPSSRSCHTSFSEGLDGAPLPATSVPAGCLPSCLLGGFSSSGTQSACECGVAPSLSPGKSGQDLLAPVSSCRLASS